MRVSGELGGFPEWQVSGANPLTSDETAARFDGAGRLDA